ncbi:hypothetical protein ACMBCN_00470 [Candidatus Liberibacter asiaticus]|nr:hypothetical protein [Candidatus Liberibacter asiaticus]
MGLSRSIISILFIYLFIYYYYYYYYYSRTSRSEKLRITNFHVITKEQKSAKDEKNICIYIFSPPISSSPMLLGGPAYNLVTCSPCCILKGKKL